MSNTEQNKQCVKPKSGRPPPPPIPKKPPVAVKPKLKIKTGLPCNKMSPTLPVSPPGPPKPPRTFSTLPLGACLTQEPNGKGSIKTLPARKMDKTPSHDNQKTLKCNLFLDKVESAVIEQDKNVTVHQNDQVETIKSAESDHLVIIKSRKDVEGNDESSDIVTNSIVRSVPKPIPRKRISVKQSSDVRYNDNTNVLTSIRNTDEDGEEIIKSAKTDVKSKKPLPPPKPKLLLRSKSSENVLMEDKGLVSRRRSRSVGDLVSALHAEDTQPKSDLATSKVNCTEVSPTGHSLSPAGNIIKLDQRNNDVIVHTTTPSNKKGLNNDIKGSLSFEKDMVSMPHVNVCEFTEIVHNKGQDGRCASDGMNSQLPSNDNQRLHKDKSHDRTMSVPNISTQVESTMKSRTSSQSSESSEDNRSRKQSTGTNIVRKGSKLLSQLKHRVSRKNSSGSESSYKTASTFYCDIDESMRDSISEITNERPESMVSVFSDISTKSEGLEPSRRSSMPQVLAESITALRPLRPQRKMSNESEKNKEIKQNPSKRDDAQAINMSASKSQSLIETDNTVTYKTSKPKIFTRHARPAPPPPTKVIPTTQSTMSGKIQILPGPEQSRAFTGSGCDKSSPSVYTPNAQLDMANKITTITMQTPVQQTEMITVNKDEIVTHSVEEADTNLNKNSDNVKSNSIKTRSKKRNSGRKSVKYDSMGYVRPKSGSDGDVDDMYADIDSSDEGKKPRSMSDASGASSHIYEPVSGHDASIYQDISDNEEIEKATLSPRHSTEHTLESPPIPPPRNKRVKALMKPVHGTDSESTSADEDYISPDSLYHDSTQTSSGDEEDSFMVSPVTPRHTLRDCDYIDMSGKRFSRENILAAIQEQSSATSDHASSSDDEADQEHTHNKPKTTRNKIFHIAEEIVNSEKVFVDVLDLLNRDFRRAVDDTTEKLETPVIPAAHMNKILNYLPQLHNFNVELLQDLKERLNNWDNDPRVADIFVRKGPFLKLYTSYIKDFENMTAALDDACRKYPPFAEVVLTFQMSERCANLALKHYMLKPIQRIPQYKMLLQDYQKHLTDDSPDKKDTQVALSIVSEVADHANEAMKEGDNFQKLLELQEQLVGDFQVVEPGRILIKDGELKKLSRKEMQPRRFLLFNDVLLHTTPLAVGNCRVNNVLTLAGMKVLRPTQEDFQNEFSIITVQRSFSLSANSPQERDKWISTLTKTIQEFVQKKSTFGSKIQEMLEEPTDFVLGSKAPIWIPDARVTMCMLCTTEFTVTFRRHHCRACGKVVCGLCSDYKAPLPYIKYKQARVCEDCFGKLQQDVNESALPKVPDSPGGTQVNFRQLFVTGKGQRKSSVLRLTKKRPAVLQEVCANDQGASMSGYMKILKGKKWKKMWFVLKEKVLYTYKASEDMAAMESTPLLGYEIETYTEYFEGVEPPLLFQITHKGRPATVFRTESPTAVKRWVDAMNEAVVP